MALFQNGTELDKPVGSEIQVETLPELYPPRHDANGDGIVALEDDAAWAARQAAWAARTRTITLVIDDGSLLGSKQTTAALAFNATPATIQTALEGLAALAPGDIKVTGSGRTFQYEFSGVFANKGMKRMYSTITGSGQKIYFETVVAGFSEATQRLVKEDATRRALGVSGSPVGSGLGQPLDIGDPRRYRTGISKLVQEKINGAAGTRTLTFDGQTTTALAFDATAGTIQAALEALNNVVPGDFIVTSPAANTYNYEYAGNLAGSPQPTLIVDPALLTGGTTPRAVITVLREGTVGSPKDRL